MASKRKGPAPGGIKKDRWIGSPLGILALGGIATFSLIVAIVSISLSQGAPPKQEGYKTFSESPYQYSGASPSPSPEEVQTAAFKGGYQEIRMDVLYSGYSPNQFVIQKGVLVKWVIEGKELSGCNEAIKVPAYGLEFDISAGTNTIEFTPNETGLVRWTCWMGMLQGAFAVVDDLASPGNITASLSSSAPKSGGGCGCGCGGRRA